MMHNGNKTGICCNFFYHPKIWFDQEKNSSMWLMTITPGKTVWWLKQSLIVFYKFRNYNLINPD